MCVQIVLGDSLPRTSEDDTRSLTQRGWSVLVQHCITLVAWPATSETRLVLLCCNTSQHTNKSTSCALVMRKASQLTGLLFCLFDVQRRGKKICYWMRQEEEWTGVGMH